MGIALFFIVLGALIFVHELGHFVCAKKAGVRVDEFALGFPPPIFSKKIGGTRYSLNFIPFGGYVKIYGEDGDDANEDRSEAASGQAAADKGASLSRKPRYVQAAVLASGVAGNLVFAWLLLSLGFLVGIPSSVEGRYAGEVRDPALMITGVFPDSPAARAGLKAGDKILSLADGARRFEGINVEAARRFIGESAGALTVRYRRGGESREIPVSPASGIIPGKKAVGVTLDTVGTVRFGPLRSLAEGFRMTSDLLRGVSVGLAVFVKEAFLGQADFSTIAGPVGIAGLLGEARMLGLAYLLSFTAFISVNLAVINLLPVPALDGGRLLFLGLEALARRPIPPRIVRACNTAGFALLVFLMAVITYRDIMKLF